MRGGWHFHFEIRYFCVPPSKTPTWSLTNTSYASYTSYKEALGSISKRRPQPRMGAFAYLHTCWLGFSSARAPKWCFFIITQISILDIFWGLLSFWKVKYGWQKKCPSKVMFSTCGFCCLKYSKAKKWSPGSCCARCVARGSEMTFPYTWGQVCSWEHGGGVTGTLEDREQWTKGQSEIIGTVLRF